MTGKKNLGKMIYDAIFELSSGFNVEMTLSKIEQELAPELAKAYPAQGERLIKYLSGRPKRVSISAPPSCLKRVEVDDALEPILNESAMSDIEEFVGEHRKAEKLLSVGLHPRSRMMLHGPPGNGKTMAAQMIGKMLDVPVFETNMAQLVDSYMGATSKNIDSVLSYCASFRCVLFIDEFDSVGTSRVHGHGIEAEMSRVVNQLLINLDRLPPHTVLIGATNVIDRLDEALLRRFDTSIRIEQPDESTSEKIVRQSIGFLKSVLNASEVEILISEIRSATKNSRASAWEITSLCTRVKRDVVLASGEGIQRILSEFKQRRNDE